MGKGIALVFRKRYPDMYKDYVRRYWEGKVRLGEPYLYKCTSQSPINRKQLCLPDFLERDKPNSEKELDYWILNLPTKKHWRSRSNLEDILEALDYLKGHYQGWGIKSIAVPILGCGEGGLEWQNVGPADGRLGGPTLRSGPDGFGGYVGG